MSPEQEKITLEIQKLKSERNALIIAHNYQREEVQDLADFTVRAKEAQLEIVDLLEGHQAKSTSFSNRFRSSSISVR